MERNKVLAKFLSASALVAMVFAVPYLVSAADTGGGGETGGGISLPNPLGATETVGGVIGNIVSALQVIAVPLVAVMVLVGGYQMLFSAGNPEKFKTGKNIILYAVIGYAILLLAGGLTDLIRNILGE